MSKPVNSRRKIYHRESIYNGMTLDAIVAMANENTTAKIEIDHDYPSVELFWEEDETDEQMNARLDESSKLAEYLKDQKKKDKAKREARDLTEYERLKKKFEKGKK